MNFATRSSIVLAILISNLVLKAPPADAQPINLISIADQWKFDQSGQDLSGQFQQVDFDDALWPAGRALFGLETTSPNPYPFAILTPLSVGGGVITYYFRTRFHFGAHPGGVTLISTNYVDDGAVYYLNGVEVGRLRMPNGPVTASTFAQLATPEGERVLLNFPAASLVEGENVLAVEVHQQSTLSSDIVFGLSLTAILPASGPVRIVTQPVSRMVDEGNAVTLSAEVTGSPPYFIQWFRDRMPLPEGTNRQYMIAAVSTNDAGVYHFTVSNLQSSAVSDDAILTVIPAPLTFIALTNEWRYDARGIDLGTDWRDPAFDDAMWPSSRALFYNETAPLPAPKNTLLPLNSESHRPIVTYYFRTHFYWPTDPEGAALTARLLLDDGAVIYLNGVEAARVGMPPPPASITHDTLAQRIVGDVTGFDTIRLASGSLRQGTNVLAVEVHQATVGSTDVVFGLALATNFVVGLPDLILWGPSADPRVLTRTFSASDCEVEEGCAVPGVRRLLVFDTETRNVGTADLSLGSPVGNPLFEFATCHGHYHFQDFAEYRLLNLDGVPLATGNKVGFCLEDVQQWDPGATSQPRYDCDFQGIQRGWADIYSSSLPCQWVDITDLPPGNYLLEMEIDPANRIEELDESNNVARVQVVIEAPCAGPPANDLFSGGEMIPYRVASATAKTECATKEIGEPNHAGNAGGASLWYRWRAPASGGVTISTDGSDFDTLLAVYRGTSLGTLTLVASDDDGGSGTQSLITTGVTAGTLYHIAVDGYSGAIGRLVLNINPGANNTFPSCLVITGWTGMLMGNNTGTSKDIGEPNHGGNAGGRSVWYCWTAPASGPVVFDTGGSTFDTLLGVYTGGSVGTLTLVADNNDAGAGGSSRVSFEAISGTTYRLAVDGANGASGLFRLNWRSPSQAIRVARASAGQLELQVEGVVGDHYIIQTSPELKHWVNWLRVTNFTGTVSFIDPAATNAQTFYRARFAP